MTNPQQVALSEYRSRVVATGPPTVADERLAEELRGGGETTARLDVRWLAGDRVEVSAGSWVGVVRFSQFEVQVVPKLVGGSLGVLRMLEYAGGVQLLRRLPSQQAQPPQGHSLLDLVCLLLTEEAHALLREGLLRDYRSTDETLEVLRGRLRFRDQYLRRFGQLDRLECHYDEYDSDTPDNQLIAVALDAARRRTRDPAIRFAALRVGGIFDEACAPPTADAEHYRRAIHYDRRNERYRPAHELAALVLRGLAFDDLFNSGTGEIGAFLFDMNSIFELFVTRLVTDALADVPQVRVSSQASIKAVIYDDDAGRSYSSIRPDLLIEHTGTGHRVPLDVKYKLYEGRKVSTSDIYQAFLYAFALGSDDLPTAGIIYPATSSVTGPNLSIRPEVGPVAARITGIGLDVPAILDRVLGADRDTMLQEVRSAIERTADLRSTPELAFAN